MSFEPLKLIENADSEIAQHVNAVIKAMNAYFQDLFARAARGTASGAATIKTDVESVVAHVEEVAKATPGSIETALTRIAGAVDALARNEITELYSRLGAVETKLASHILATSAPNPVPTPPAINEAAAIDQTPPAPNPAPSKPPVGNATLNATIQGVTGTGKVGS